MTSFFRLWNALNIYKMAYDIALVLNGCRAPIQSSVESYITEQFKHRIIGIYLYR